MVAKASDSVVCSSDFWRGVIDGNGTIFMHTRGYPVLKLYGSHDLLAQFRMFIKGIVYTEATVRPRKNIFNFSIEGTQALTIIRILYETTEVSLDRKKQIANNILTSYVCLGGSVEGRSSTLNGVG
jgi:hypothetical protein